MGKVSGHYLTGDKLYSDIDAMLKKCRYETYSEKMYLLDEITPIVLSHLDKLNPIEQSIIYYIIIPTSRKLTTLILPKKETTKFLSKKIKMESKSTSVYLRRLVERGYLVRTKINNKDFYYAITHAVFVDWFLMRQGVWELQKVSELISSSQKDLN